MKAIKLKAANAGRPNKGVWVKYYDEKPETRASKLNAYSVSGVTAVVPIVSLDKSSFMLMPVAVGENIPEIRDGDIILPVS